jgi:hypothetical protein
LTKIKPGAVEAAPGFFLWGANTSAGLGATLAFALAVRIVSNGHASRMLYPDNVGAMNTGWAHNGQVVVTVVTGKPVK